MWHTLRPDAATKSLRRVVLCGVMSSVGLTAVIVLLGGAVWVYGRQPAPAVAEQATEAILPAAPLQVGDIAPDFTLHDLDGKEVHLSDYLGRMPVLIEFGSITCPFVTGHSGQLDQVAREYEGKAQLLFIYANEDHPGHGEMRPTGWGTYCALPQVENRDDRQERAELFQSTMKTSRRILVDEDGAASVAARYGRTGHALVMVDTQGRICWSDAGSSSGSLVQAALQQQIEPGSPSSEPACMTQDLVCPAPASPEGPTTLLH